MDIASPTTNSYTQSEIESKTAPQSSKRRGRSKSRSEAGVTGEESLFGGIMKPRGLSVRTNPRLGEVGKAPVDAQNKLRIATLNLGNAGLGGTDKEARLNEVMTGLEPLKWDVLGLCETHTRNASHQIWTSKEDQSRNCGAEIHAGEQEGRIGGVGFIIRPQIKKYVKDVRIISNRIAKPLRKRWTWKSNLPTTTNSEIDYVLCNKRKLITNIERIDRLAVRSDHRMVRATIRVKFDRKEHKKRDPMGEIDANKLKTAIKESKWNAKEVRITRKYEHFIKTLQNCVKTAETAKPRMHCTRITDETAALLQKLAEEKKRNRDPELCRKLSKQARKKLENDYAAYKQKRLLKTAEERKSLKRCRKDIAQTKDLTQGLRDDKGIIQTDRQKIEEICRNFYTNLFASNTKVDRIQREEEVETPPEVTENEPMDNKGKTIKAPQGWGKPERWKDKIIKKLGKEWHHVAMDREKYRALCDDTFAPKQHG
ncbi:putative RNA-directed DNA polymerase from mobile element jockey-like [Ditylenchus destructor]|uniref:RNA-directed DNA polymerase from mobile element jockey-like n=1 Tax=Ditylenchus destructor TaxID=166010 RepID=A0AAD4N392_9BILA|nr:putative RNA-directed DNA polymerase from mobile element jockey-like [Ditylenchus destructor]